MAFSPDSRFFVTSSGIVLQTDTADRQQVCVLRELQQPDAILFFGRGGGCVTFSRDGKRIASARADGTLQVWDVGRFTKR